MKPYFSIVIPLYNKEAHIKATLDSVFNQSFKDFEAIIVNDGSTDRSLDIVSTFKDKRIQIINKKNEGASKTRNFGIGKAKGKFIALLDGDDLWNSGFLQTIFDAIMNFPDESVFTTAIAHKYKNEIVPVKYYPRPKKDTSLLDYFSHSLSHSILSGSSIVFNRTILETTGLFDPAIKSGQDTDFWIRIGINYQIVFINKVLVYYVYNPNSLSNTTFNSKSKPRFDKYKSEEKHNKKLKGFLDKNRFSLAILSKVHNDIDSFNFFKNELEIKNLKLKRRILLNCPRLVLILLLQIKSIKGRKLYYKRL